MKCFFLLEEINDLEIIDPCKGNKKADEYDEK
jgi:hypothetical protein